MTTAKRLDSARAANQASDGQAPSSSFRIALQSPSPSDPRGQLPALAAMIENYKRSNDRMALGLRIGFRQVENQYGRRPSRQS